MRSDGNDSYSDADLVRLSADGDQAAFQALYRRHAGHVQGWLRRRCADPEVIETVMQETFHAVWKNADRWRGEGEVAAWIRVITQNKLKDEWRRRPWPRPVSADDPLWKGLLKPSAEDVALHDLQYSRLHHMLWKRSAKLRDVVQACWLDGLTMAEAAARLGIPLGTVKTRLKRARDQLRVELGGPGGER